MARWVAPFLGLASLMMGAAAEAPPVPAVITSTGDYWILGDEEKKKPHPLDMVMDVYYYDAAWSLLYGQTGSAASYLPVRGRAMPIKSGQRVRFEGTVVPADGINGELVRATVLADNILPEPMPTAGRLEQLASLNGHWVQAEGYVFAQKEPDSTHVEVKMLCENHLLNLTMQIGATEPIPQLVGARIRVQGVYDAAPNPAGKIQHIEFWTAAPDRLEVLGWLAGDVRFNLPRTAIDRLEESIREPWVRVVGEVRSQDVGKSLTVRDNTGQVVIATAQPEVLPANAAVEVIGRVVASETGWTLAEPLYRGTGQKADDTAGRSPGAGQVPQRLRLAEQVRTLPADKAGRRFPVTLRGVVTWLDVHASTFYLQDSSGGVRVWYEPAQRGQLAPGASFTVAGVAVRGETGSEVKLVEAFHLGAAAYPPARAITLEQALSGAEEGLRVEMRGLVRQIVDEGGWRRLDLTGPTGEFAAFLPPGVGDLDELRGAVVRVRGVCTTVTDAKHEIANIRLWLPDRESVLVDEPAPHDPFAAPAQSTMDLRQAAGSPTVSQRVRVTGEVLLHVPGRYLYLQDAVGGLLVLSRESRPLRPGEWVEMVGLPGRAGNRFALRDGTWRAVSRGSPIQPHEIKQPRQLDPAADAQLVRVSAVLRQVVTDQNRVHLTVEAEGAAFEVTVPAGAGWTPPEPGSRLALTGVYVLEFDEYRQPRGFHLELRGPADVSVQVAPPLWTPARAMVVAGGLGFCVVLGVVWVALLRRQVRQQTELLRRHMAKEVALQAKMQSELERSSRLDSLGVLAGGIAHDFNNLLTAIMGNLGLMRLEDDAMKAVGPLVTNAERATKRAADVTHQLLTFAKGGDPVRSAIELPQVVQEAADFVRHGSSVKIDLSVEPVLPPVNADAGQISRVVHNLVLNAVEAMPGGGSVRIELRTRQLAAEEIPLLAPGRYVQLSVIDTGEGIPADRLPKIFDPYFSTKAKGSGLGLATAHSIVKKHKGHIEAESGPAPGATFRVLLPVATAPRVDSASQFEADPAAPGAKVLFMDDEASICQVATAIMKKGGHSPTIVHDGLEAVKEFNQAEAAGAPFDVVILDLTVPGGMGGREAVAKLRRINPQVRAVASSGYANDPVMANHRDYGFVAVLPKPYDPEAFARVINRVRRRKA